ncbi:quinone oxidoreductase family protein [Arthrobacter psychrochitiniphilus]|uniref:quinone oxidoreductase family protein n=1 Tax=Arthrobacter psychrochitiniphilus TaxID=291045 RepID=UPI003F7B9665
MQLTNSRQGDNVTSATDEQGILAALVDSPGATPRMGSVVLRPRTAGATLLEVVAAPLNPLDLLVASGKFHSARHETPYVPGSECVGLVLASDIYPQGTRVYAQCHASPATPGALATKVLVADKDLLALPEGVDPVLAAAVGNSGTAAYMPLIENASMRLGDTVLILGATGAVGQLAVQIAHLAGAGCVIAVGRNLATLEHLLTLGADAVVELRANETNEELTERLLAVAGPVDVVLDGLYGAPLESALNACAPNARVVNIGNLAGATATIPAGLLRGKQISLSGFAGLHTPLQAKRTALSWLWTALTQEKITVQVRPFTFQEIPEAWHAQTVSPHAKCVILPGHSDSSLPWLN